MKATQDINKHMFLTLTCGSFCFHHVVVVVAAVFWFVQYVWWGLISRSLLFSY